MTNGKIVVLAAMIACAVLTGVFGGTWPGHITVGLVAGLAYRAGAS